MADQNYSGRQKNAGAADLIEHRIRAGLELGWGVTCLVVSP